MKRRRVDNFQVVLLLVSMKEWMSQQCLHRRSREEVEEWRGSESKDKVRDLLLLELLQGKLLMKMMIVTVMMRKIMILTRIVSLTAL